MENTSRITPSPMMEVTPARIFWTRRQWLARFSLGMVGTALGSGLVGCEGEKPKSLLPLDALPDIVEVPEPVSRKAVTARQVASSYTNFYELGAGKAQDFRQSTAAFEDRPWTVEVGGACDRPGRFAVEDLLKFPLQERLYHFRCVERWAMNVPWIGFPLWRLWEQVVPRPEARWVIFESRAEPAFMPGIDEAPHFPWPYREALRRDESEHDLAFLALGIYGHTLPPWHGAPVRLVVPWKYGYKSAKSIVKITWVEDPPPTFWSEVSPHEYGLLSNVNPNIPHPRWNQDKSFWLRDDPVWPTAQDVFPTPMFNGYEAQVAELYPDEPRRPAPPLQPGDTAR